MIKAPFRYDMVGSLKRPDALKKIWHEVQAGTKDRTEALDISQQEIKRIVNQQVNLGFHDVTDGEFSRSWWHLDFLWGLKGTKKYDYHESYKFHGSKTRTDNVSLAGKIAYNPDHPFFGFFKYLQSIVPEGVLAKQTIPSPSMLFRDNRSDLALDFYNSWDEYLLDLAKAYQQTIRHFYDLGCRYLQMDDTTWGFLISKLNETKDDPKAHAEYEKMAQDCVKVINMVLQDKPADLTVTTHVCRGNFKSTYLFSGGYEAVASYLGQLNYDGFFLEYDNERSGGFAPLKDIFNNRPQVRIVLGLVTSKTPELEDQKVLIERIKEASTYVPLENLALSTQCGFASTEEGNLISEEEQWAKLTLVRDTAKKVWEDA